MLNIEKNKQSIQPERAPQKREAPLPLRSPGVRRRAPVPRGPSKIDGLFKNQSDLNFDQNTGFHGGPSARRKGYQLAMWSLLASMIDGLILISASCVFMLAFSMIVKTSFGSLLQGMEHSQHQLLFFLETFFVFSWIYMVCVRSLMGSSIGEWACELRLGQPQERLSSAYILRVALRSTLILITGVITLPFLSLILGKDLAGSLTGLRLFSLK